MRFMRDPLFDSLAELVDYFSHHSINVKSGRLEHACPPSDTNALDTLFGETLAFFG